MNAKSSNDPNPLADVTNTVERPFFLPRIDPASQMTVNGIPVTGVDPGNTTMVTNANIGATLTVNAVELSKFPV